MPEHIRFGKRGEDLATLWLEKKGYQILARNWRYRRFEIDIIASKNNLLHFIEIKSRHGLVFGLPEESVSEKKLINILEAAEEYQFLHPEWERIQFDILAITEMKTSTEYFLIEDVYL
jgi:putative endonuclease